MPTFVLSRRQLMASAYAFSVLQATLPLTRARAADVRLRENIQQFSQDPQKVAALRAAVKNMKEKSAANHDDPLGWYYWSASHGTDLDVPSNLENIYNQCDHTDFLDFSHIAVHFLSWHRAFLFFFESALKQAAKDAEVTTALELPYWDWYSSPKLPKIFTEGDATSNPLWHRRTRTDLTGVGLDKSVFRFSSMLRAPGTPLPRTFSFSLEGNPHGTVHGNIGGEMGSVQTSARDPIFWLHHANIDRLWTAWMKGGNRNLPAPDSTWASQSWDFDTAGQWHQTAGVMLDSEPAPLAYRYDNESMPIGVAPEMAMAAASTKVIEAQPQSVDIGQLKTMESAEGAAAKPIALTSTSGTIQLGNDTVEVNLRLADQAAAQLESFAQGAETAEIKSAKLVLEDIELSPEGKEGGFSFDVVVSLQNSQAEPMVLATLNTFTLSTASHQIAAKAGKQTFSFPLNEILPALGPISPEALAKGLKVTFRPSQPPGAETAADFLHVGAVKLEASTRPVE
jgi:tyrosinase